MKTFYRIGIFLILLSLQVCKTKSNELPESKGTKSDRNPLIGMYLFVTSKDGLNLRKEPSVNAPKITTLPYGFSTKILGFQPPLVTIQTKQGFWLQIEAFSKKGWVFSGFVSVSDTENDDPSKIRKHSSADAFNFSGGIEIPNSSESDLSIVSRHKMDWYEIFVSKKPDPARGHCLNKDFVLQMFARKFASKNEFRLDMNNDWEEFVAINRPIRNVLLTYTRALCSCADPYAEKFYFLGKNKLYAFKWPFKKSKAMCGPDQVYDGIEIRYDAAQKTGLIVKSQSPAACNYSTATEQELQNPKIGKTEYLFASVVNDDFELVVVEGSKLTSEQENLWNTYAPFSLAYRPKTVE